MRKLSNKFVCILLIILFQLSTFSNVAIAAPISVKGVSLNKTSDSIVVGASDTLVATITPTDAKNKKVTWISSNTGVASVDSTGKVTGIAAGTANVTVKTADGGFTATCIVTVTVPVTGVSLNKTSDSIAVGVSDTLVATITPTNATNKNVTWTSSNTEVASVDSTGKVTGIAAGTANVTVKTADGGFTATCVVTVTVPTVTALSVSSTSATQVNLTWSAVTGATSYNIYRSISTTGTFTLIGTSTTTSYSDTGLTGNTTYYYKVSVMNANSEGGQSSAVIAVTLVATVTNLCVYGISATRVNLIWNAVSGATSYNIYRSMSATGTFTLIATDTPHFHYDTSLTANTTYYYKVSAMNVNGEGGQSSTVTAVTLVAPVTGLIVNTSATQANLTWSGVSGATSYNVYQSMSATGTFTLIGTSTTTSYSDTGLLDNTTYYYKVSAMNANGEGGQSSAVTAVTMSTYNMFGISPSSNEIDLTWSGVSGATSYNVYRSMSATGTFTLIGTSTSASYSDIGLTANTKYYYKVSVVNANSEFGLSSAITAVTKGPVSVNIASNWFTRNGYYLDSRGYVWAWGYAGGNGTKNDSNVPVLVSNLSNIIAISGGDDEGFALDSSGHVWAWGGWWGVYGAGAVQVPNLSNIVAISGGYVQSLALDSYGHVWMKNGTLNGSFVQVSNLSNIVAIWGTYEGGYALDNSGRVWWMNSHGTFVFVLKLSNTVALAATDSNVYVLDNSGHVWAWGYGYYGALGNGTTSDSNVPVQVSNLSNIVAIAGGHNTGYALDNSGHVWAWGRGEYGELGNGTTSDSNVPVQVSNLSNIVAIAGTGHWTGYALDSSDHVWAWGRGNEGELGNGTTGVQIGVDYREEPIYGSTTPVQVSNLPPNGGSGISANIPQIETQDPKAIQNSERYYGDPIDTATGAHVLDQTLLKVQGTEPFSFDLHYNSLLLKPGPFGYGWESNYDASLEVQSSGNVIINWSANRSNTFALTGSSYVPQDHAIQYDKLVKNADGTFTLTRKDNSIYHFDSNGKLSQLGNGHGQSLNMSYDSSGRLIQVLDPVSGQAFSIVSNSSGLVQSISNNGNQTITFTYDGNQNLVTITKPNGTITQSRRESPYFVRSR